MNKTQDTNLAKLKRGLDSNLKVAIWSLFIGLAVVAASLAFSWVQEANAANRYAALVSEHDTLAVKVATGEAEAEVLPVYIASRGGSVLNLVKDLKTVSGTKDQVLSKTDRDTLGKAADKAVKTLSALKYAASPENVKKFEKQHQDAAKQKNSTVPALTAQLTVEQAVTIAGVKAPEPVTLAKTSNPDKAAVNAAAEQVKTLEDKNTQLVSENAEQLKLVAAQDEAVKDLNTVLHQMVKTVPKFGKDVLKTGDKASDKAKDKLVKAIDAVEKLPEDADFATTAPVFKAYVDAAETVLKEAEVNAAEAAAQSGASEFVNPVTGETVNVTTWYEQAATSSWLNTGNAGGWTPPAANSNGGARASWTPPAAGGNNGGSNYSHNNGGGNAAGGNSGGGYSEPPASNPAPAPAPTPAPTPAPVPAPPVLLDCPPQPPNTFWGGSWWYSSSYKEPCKTWVENYEVDPFTGEQY